MDSRDSSSTVSAAAASPPPVVSGEGGQSVDDDGVFSLAKEAAVCFQAHMYAECLQVLKQLLLKKPGDPKVLHNIAVTEYFCDGCSDLRKLLSKLCDVKKRSEDARRAEDSSEAGNNTLKNCDSISRGGNALMLENKDFNVYASEYDTSVASLNISMIWYHLHEYAKVISILEPMYQNIEPLDESIALQICLLLLDAGLALQNATKSADVLSYLEKTFNINSSPSSILDAANTGHQQSSDIAAKSTSFPAASDMSIVDAPANTDIDENALSRTISEENIDYDKLFSTLDRGREDISRVGGMSTSSNWSISSPKIDPRLLQLYKVRFLLLTRNLKSIKREVKEAMNLTRGGDSTAALLLKSQFEYARGNYTKAIKLLVASNYRTEAVISSLCNNNFGCIYYQVGQFHTAGLFFSRALTNCSAVRKDNQKKALSQDESLIILYNCGLQYLACGKPIIAAHCFHKASLVFSKQPLLWLRIAECCLLALEKGLVQSIGSSSESSEVKIHVIGRGKWRKLVVEDDIVENDLKSSIENGKIVEDKPIQLSVCLARQSLLNALYLMNLSSRATESSLPSQISLENLKSNAVQLAGDGKVSNGDVKEMKIGQGLNDTLKNSIMEFEQIRAREYQMIKQIILANLAFVELELGNPLNALSAAKSLLEVPDCAKIFVFLARVYAAEAICLLGRPKEAAEQLSKYMNEETGFIRPYKEEDCGPWEIKLDVESKECNNRAQTSKSSTDSRKFTFPCPEEARGILFVNMAALCARQGDLEQAHKFATHSLSVIPNNTKALLTLVYVNLMLGKTREALSILKQCNRVKFLPGSKLS